MKKNTPPSMLLKSLVLVGFLSVAGLAQSAQGIWIEGFGQGNLEYFIDNKTARLYISCPTSDGSADAMSGVSLTINGKEVKKFKIIVGAYDYDGPFDADSRVDSDNFKSLLTELRKSDAIVKINNTTIVFPKSNAAKVIPKVNSKAFECNTSF